jgi:acetylornithine deacetylase/succinyl-diaminopimelate desuccinylase-like protein
LPIVLGPELLMSIHNINERLPVDALEQGIKVYTELIRVIQEAEKWTGVDIQAD